MDISIDVIAGAAVTWLLAVVSVALWTVRVALSAAGRRFLGAAVAGIEALTFTLAFGRIVADLDNPVGLVAYALGVGAGTLVGLAADERFSPGQSWVRVIVEGDGVALTQALQRRRWPVTSITGTGPRGPIAELMIAVDDTKLRALVDDLDQVSPEAFRTVERLRSSRGRPLPGLRQVGQHRTTRDHRGRVSSTSVPAPGDDLTAALPP